MVIPIDQNHYPTDGRCGAKTRHSRGGAAQPRWSQLPFQGRSRSVVRVGGAIPTTQPVESRLEPLAEGKGPWNILQNLLQMFYVTISDVFLIMFYLMIYDYIYIYILWIWYMKQFIACHSRLRGAISFFIVPSSALCPFWCSLFYQIQYTSTNKIIL